MASSTLDMFMGLKSINPNFVDAWGNPAKVSEENIRNIIGKMGFDAADDSALITHFNEKEKQHWLSPLPPVSVLQKNETYQFEVRLPIDSAADPLIYKITLEDKSEIEQTICATVFPLVATKEISDLEFQCYQVEIAADLPIGYHSLAIYEKDIAEALATMSLIITPSRCYSPEAITQGEKIWGTSVQLYCLKSEANWGIGDFSDLKTLLAKTKENGGDFIGLNPIHALSPSQPDNSSPYSPSSRKWLNILYTDITAVDEFARNKTLQARINSEQFKQELIALRAPEWVDYEGVTALKLTALRELFATLNEGSVKSKKRQAAFNQYVKEKGESLTQQASYDALQFHFLALDANSWGWPVWPEAFQSFQSEASQTWIKENLQEVLFWCYTQWVAELQLQEADKLAKSLGMTLGIYRDLAVGVGISSSEIWANHALYCEHISVGAPPDVLGPLGQSWGLPPIAPEQLQEAAYQPFIELLQSNMSHCGALRIDHVMALLRLWWVPDNASAEKGAYVYYPVEDMLNLLALESVRNECLVIGEDLGTVPDGIDVLLKDAGVYSYKVFFFEQADDGGYISPAHYADQAMATLATHDMPTIKGFWHCEDLHLGRELGLYPKQDVYEGLLRDRLVCKQQILNSLHGHGSLPADYPRDAAFVGMDQTLNFALQVHLAKSTSALLSLQLEDFLEMDKPVNVPGTSNEYRNWQRKLSQNIEPLFENQQIKTLLSDITLARKI
ncbi:4-alpha-glucanotransferase [Psychromonas antarctica]|uniref:4-alpha-glucanotransferase n=1 Tax=Psychromonas antarctica TaxID=67573 RepID=UPI001EE8CD04|nr:4-alpha-glucanotransferase [Psychromonas antarctica]MCG6201573.1 4-alpha-glucanotransferase [Psychromonas antarctica]